MLPLEVFLTLLDEMRAEAIGGVETGTDRDAFAFGSVHGQLRVLAQIRERLNDLVEYNASRED